MERRSAFEYGPGPTRVELTVSVRPWTPEDRTLGEARRTATGVTASDLWRRDMLLTVVLRVWEAEWVAVRNLIRFGQTSQAFLWFPEAPVALSVPVYLETPEMGAGWGPTRDGSYPRLFDVPITLRDVGGGNPWQPYFEAR